MTMLQKDCVHDDLDVADDDDDDDGNDGDDDEDEEDDDDEEDEELACQILTSQFGQIHKDTYMHRDPLIPPLSVPTAFPFVCGVPPCVGWVRSPDTWKVHYMTGLGSM